MYPLLTTTQVATLLAVSPRTICLLAESQELPGLKVGRQLRFHPEAVQHWLASRNGSAQEKYSP